MCVIIIKQETAKFPEKKILKRCFYRNTDGSGYMFIRDGSIILKKGFETFNSFYEGLLKENIKEKSLIIHFRKQTAGRVCPANCNPFVISLDMDIMLSTSIVTKNMCFAHNGTFYNMKDEELSDTAMFVKNILTDKIIYDNLYTSLPLQRLINDFLCRGRAVFLHPTEGWLRFGKWEELDGCYYSNNSFKKKLSVKTNELYSFNVSRREVVNEIKKTMNIHENTEMCYICFHPREKCICNDKSKSNNVKIINSIFGSSFLSSAEKIHYIKNELSNPNELSTPDAPSQISEQHKNKVFSPVITKHIGFVKKCSKCGGQGKVKMRYMYMGWRKTTHTLSCNKCYVENRNKYFYSI